jgi:4-hydroxybenzoate polyprenyltransferase
VLVVMFCYAVYLTGLTWIGSERQMGPLFYIGVLAASLIALWHYRLIRKRDRADCFRAFLGNHWLGFAVFAGIVADYGVRLHRMPWWPQ